jgi:4-hydroxy-3-polyprenylbenzoate decarboxylase
MKFDDLREFIDCMRAKGDLQEIDGADWNLEMGAITYASSLLAKKPPCILFDHIKDYPPGFRVLTTVRNNRTAGRLIYGVDEALDDDAAVEVWRARLKQYTPLPPVQVETGPILQNVISGNDIDLLKLPWVRWHEHDGGRYICGTSVVMRDPDTGYINLGSYRFKLIDHNRIVVHIGSGHHGDVIRKKYWSKGKSCPVAILLGQDPAVFIVAGTNVAWGTPEYDFIGWMRGAAVEVTRGVHTDLPIPATAEVVLEGEMLLPSDDTEIEGPFGEASGYYGGGARPSAVTKIHTILHRDNPIIMGDPPLIVEGSGQNVLYSRSIDVREELDGLGIPGIKGVNHKYSRLILSLQQSYPGHAMRAALGSMGGGAGGYHGKMVIVVDDDINPHNLEEVLWALATRCDAETSIDICRGTWSYAIDPALAPEKRAAGNYTSSVAFFNACKPFHRMDSMPPAPKISDEARKNYQAKWGKILFS